MGNIYPGIPHQLAQLLKDQHGLEDFVETGTYLGGTAVWAAQKFQRVFTIEASKELHAQAVQQYGSLQNIHFCNGDTRDFLRQLMPHLSKPSLLWLDAHWSGGITHGSNDECPLLEEIHILNSSPHIHFLLIDDVRMFLAPPPPPHKPEHWPSIDQVIRAIQARDKDIDVCIFEDILIAVPSYAKGTVTQYVRQKHLE
ncbi:MAG: hypothetical protein AAF889_10190 [Cyanobacteria bacterium P01_D01_bin.73]